MTDPFNPHFFAQPASTTHADEAAPDVPLLMSLYWDKGEPTFIANKAFEAAFMSTKRLSE